MQKWEYKIFASHLDPAELIVLLDESGREGWELVTVVAVTDHLPLEVIEPGTAGARNTDEVAEVVPMPAFRYIFKRSPIRKTSKASSPRGRTGSTRLRRRRG
jgi:hypothetical protein